MLPRQPNLEDLEGSGNDEAKRNSP
jgi:hypothetical protein